MDAAEYQRLSQMAATGMAEAQGRTIDRNRFGAKGIDYTNEGDAPPIGVALVTFIVGFLALFAVQTYGFWGMSEMMDELARSPQASTEQIETARMLRDSSTVVIFLIALAATLFSAIGGCGAAALSGLIHCATTNQRMIGIGSFMLAGAGTVLLGTAVYNLIGHFSLFTGGIIGYAIVLSVTCAVMRFAIGLPTKFTGSLIITTFAVWIVCTLFVVAALFALFASFA
ncbi:MAG: hypothetical protein AAGD32_14160 [Planctomycetota bacterium]